MNNLVKRNDALDNGLGKVVLKYYLSCLIEGTEPMKGDSTVFAISRTSRAFHEECFHYSLHRTQDLGRFFGKIVNYPLLSQAHSKLSILIRTIISSPYDIQLWYKSNYDNKYFNNNLCLKILRDTYASGKIPKQSPLEQINSYVLEEFLKFLIHCELDLDSKERRAFLLDLIKRVGLNYTFKYFKECLKKNERINYLVLCLEVLNQNDMLGEKLCTRFHEMVKELGQRCENGGPYVRRIHYVLVNNFIK